MADERVVRREVREKVEVDDERAERERLQRERAVANRAAIVRVTQLVWFLGGVLEALLGIRFVLKLLAANPNTGFSAFVYGITDVFLAPFAGLTAQPSAGGAVLEVPTLIAMLVYGLVTWGIVRLIWILFDRWAGT